jgi:outer membrane lipoprotein-sorting protein
MRLMGKFAICSLVLVVSLPAWAFQAGNLQATIEKLNQAAKNFRSTSADFEFDTDQTEPVPDTDVLKGVSYYERNGSNFQMAAHIQTENGSPIEKVYTFSGGVFKLLEKGPGIDQVTTFHQASKFAEYVMLGFGASGNQLADKWNISDLGPEKINGVDTEKLELVAKDPAVRKNLQKVTVWMDLDRAVSLKQVFDEGPGLSRVCTYSNIKTNQPIAKGDFTFKTDKNTQFVNR